MDTDDGAEAAAPREWQLAAEAELRWEVAAENAVVITLQRGTAELRGLELAKGRPYTIIGQTAGALFTWHGCSVTTSGTASVLYISGGGASAAGGAAATNPPMVAAVNTHAQLEAKRDAAAGRLRMPMTPRSAAAASAAEPGGRRGGPRVLVVGDRDSGKSTLAAILCAYAVRAGRRVTHVQLDALDGGRDGGGCPGCVGAAQLDAGCLSAVDAVTREGITAEALHVSFWFGLAKLGDNAPLYKEAVAHLAKALDEKAARDPLADAAGCVVDTANWVDGQGLELLRHAIGALGIDVILAVGHDRLYAELSASVGSHVAVVKLPRSGGCVPRDGQARKALRTQSMREYLYGVHCRADPPRAPCRLAPCPAHFKFSDVKVYALSAPQLSAAMLPVGATMKLDPVQAKAVDPTAAMRGAVLAVLNAPAGSDASVAPLDAQEILASSCAGLVVVQEVDVAGETMTVLAPGGALPSAHFVLGGMKYMEG